MEKIKAITTAKWLRLMARLMNMQPFNQFLLFVGLVIAGMVFGYVVK